MTDPLNYVTLPPRDGEATEDTPWVLVCHGLGDSHQGWTGITSQLPLPSHGWFVVDAPIPYYDGFSWYRIPGMTGPDHTSDHMLEDLAASQERLTATIEALPVETDRLFLLGFSQGCQMVLRQALRSDDPFAGVIGISGYLADWEEYPAACGAAAEEHPYLVTHGTFDPVVPFMRSRQAIEHLRMNGFDIDWQEYAKEHTLDPGAELQAIVDFLERA
jgi:phospholipase/carboxylesterase